MAARSVGDTTESINPQSVNFRVGDAMQNCGKCMHFDGPASWCRALGVAVEETDLCDLFSDINATEANPEDFLSQLFGM